MGNPTTPDNRSRFARSRRLKAGSEFRLVYDGGEKAVGQHAVVFYRRGQADGPRIGVVASKRVGGAVKRNRAKRLLREAIRHLTGALNDQNIWVILVAKKSIDGQNAQTVQNDIRRALESAGLLSRSN